MTRPAAPKRALLIRIDRIGDLVLTLPVDRSLEVDRADWWIPQGLSFVTQASEPQRNATEVQRKFSAKQFFRLLKIVRAERYDLAVIFHAPWWISLLIWLARIPTRIGVKSQWHSFLFLNRAVRQKRSEADRSELEYNYRLVESGLELPKGTLKREFLKFKKSSASLPAPLMSGQYSVVHPGMSGSARNWPTDYYGELIRKLSERETVVITGTKSDEEFLAPLRTAVGGLPNVQWLDGKLKGHELIHVLSHAKSIVAPSTGVAHLGASTGQPVLGLYSPIRVQKAVRWGPQGNRVAIADPVVACPAHHKCLGEACPYFDCMKTVTVENVLSKLRNLESEG